MWAVLPRNWYHGSEWVEIQAFLCKARWGGLSLASSMCWLLKKRFLCANYQAGIWKRSLEADVPSPIGHGWYRGRSSNNEEKMRIDWIDGLPAPEAVLMPISCFCVSACRELNCPCLGNGMHLGVVTCVNLKPVTNRSHDTNDQDVSDDSEEDVIAILVPKILPV